MQDIFYTISGADIADREDPFQKIVEALNAFFKPKINTTYERRNVFRSLRQTKEETVTAYVTKLRQQAKNCEFKEEDVSKYAVKLWNAVRPVRYGVVFWRRVR